MVKHATPTSKAFAFVSRKDSAKAFVDRNRAAMQITKREAFYLTESDFYVCGYETFTDEFWIDLLNFWRKHIASEFGGNTAISEAK